MEPHVTSFSDLPPIVLLVDDDGDIVPLYSSHLESAGMWVATSTRPVEALATAQELRPDIIITDVDLTEDSLGLAFVSGLSTCESTLHIPLIALTHESPASIPAAARVRAALSLVKPVPPAALIADVQQLLLQSYAFRIRVDRENKKLRELAERSRGLITHGGAQPSVSATRTCPECAHPLEWIENGRVGAVAYDYYQWCAKGCGLFCFDLDAGRWVKLAASSTPPA